MRNSKKDWATRLPFLFELRNSSCEAAKVMIDSLKLKNFTFVSLSLHNVVSLAVFEFSFS